MMFNENQDQIYEDELTKVKYVRAVCACGHTTYFLKNTPTMCSHCNRTIYPSKRSEFKEKLKKEMRKKK